MQRVRDVTARLIADCGRQPGTYLGGCVHSQCIASLSPTGEHVLYPTYSLKLFNVRPVKRLRKIIFRVIFVCCLPNSIKVAVRFHNTLPPIQVVVIKPHEATVQQQQQQQQY